MLSQLYLHSYNKLYSRESLFLHWPHKVRLCFNSQFYSWPFITQDIHDDQSISKEVQSSVSCSECSDRFYTPIKKIPPSFQKRLRSPFWNDRPPSWNRSENQCRYALCIFHYWKNFIIAKYYAFSRLPLQLM